MVLQLANSSSLTLGDAVMRKHLCLIPELGWRLIRKTVVTFPPSKYLDTGKNFLQFWNRSDHRESDTLESIACSCIWNSGEAEWFSFLHKSDVQVVDLNLDKKAEFTPLTESRLPTFHFILFILHHLVVFSNLTQLL